ASRSRSVTRRRPWAEPRERRDRHKDWNAEDRSAGSGWSSAKSSDAKWQSQSQSGRWGNSSDWSRGKGSSGWRDQAAWGENQWKSSSQDQAPSEATDGLLLCSRHDRRRNWDKLELDQSVADQTGGSPRWVCLAFCPCITFVGGSECTQGLAEQIGDRQHDGESRDRRDSQREEAAPSRHSAGRAGRAEVRSASPSASRTILKEESPQPVREIDPMDI
ncbi:unnamed protein product, partial [Polarella glacialis]